MTAAVREAECACGCGRRPAKRGASYVRGHRPTSDPVPRFWSKVSKTDTCWLWTDPPGTHGYGRFHVAGRRVVLAHRYAYELLVGPIPAEMEIDHVRARGCQSRLCVNPAHLEPVTPEENMVRAQRPRCGRGHLLEGDNVGPVPGKPNQRRCRACGRDRQRAHRARKAAA